MGSRSAPIGTLRQAPILQAIPVSSPTLRVGSRFGAETHLLLCKDEAVLGPWINGRGLNLFTGGVIVVLVLLSIILMGSVLYPQIGREMIIAILLRAA